MSQRAQMKALDAKFRARFTSAGLADLATYKPHGPGTTPIVDVSVLIDRNIAYQDTLSGIVSSVIQITAFRSEIGESNPAKGSTFTVGSEVFSVDRVELLSDESRVVMTVVTKGSC